MRLARTAPVPPVRAIHVGLGAFFRAHQAWYTQQANASGPASEAYGVAAFTGRRPDAAEVLSAQDAVYHLLTRGPEGDSAELIECLAGAYASADLSAWKGFWASPAVAYVTLTVSEAGYFRSDAVVQRVVDGLQARMSAGAGPIAIVPCDNLMNNGSTVGKLVLDCAARSSAELAAWATDNVSFVSTMVDRITPATTDSDRAEVLSMTGFADASPVVTEPFTEWVLAGDFPGGRPAWEAGGAQFVSDVKPFEQRKLWLLNGSHSLLAYAGPTRGHRTVAEAIGDPVCRSWVEQWWDEACRHLPLSASDLAAYRSALLSRYENPRIRHELRQIAMDGSEKFPIRILPVLARERANGVLPAAGVTALAGWIAHLREGTYVNDPRADELKAAVGNGPDVAARHLLQVLNSRLADDAGLIQAVAARYRELTT
jgi:fructuronate reductase